MINWKTRVKNKTFWITVIPAIFVLVQSVMFCFGFSWDFNEVANNIISVVNALFMVLGLLGIIVDPTTVGVGDSERALSYTEPANDHPTNVDDDYI